MTSIKIGWSNGVTIVTKKNVIRFDPVMKGNETYNLISHAHGDHIGGLQKGLISYLTAETDDILSFNKGKCFENFNPLKYGKEIKIDDLKITAHNAGHILGSAQFEVRSPELSIVYTGDINCRDMLTTSAAKTVPCDVLILETTYGNPSYVFPSLGEIYTEIINWITDKIYNKKIPVFRVYSTGKAQEIIRLINKFTTIPVVTNSIISRINKAYIKNGIKIRCLDSGSVEGQELIKSKQCAYIVSNNEELPAEEYSLALATGWAIKYSLNNGYKSFPLSNHADFEQLLTYVKQVNPKKVYTIHGFRDCFSHHLNKKLGIKAQPILPLKQTVLKDFQ